METTIVITTINKPVFIESLCENINRFGHKDTDILIIGDIKTPPIQEYCEGISRQYSVPIEYLNVADQERELVNHKPLLDIIPYNTPDRTILGGIIAYLRGSERIIAVEATGSSGSDTADQIVTTNGYEGIQWLP